jgi:hypothetical protein
MNYADVKDDVYYWVRVKGEVGYRSLYIAIRQKEAYTKIWKMPDNYVMEDDFQKEWEVVKEIPNPEDINRIYDIITHSDLTGDGYFPSIREAIDHMNTDKSVRILTIGVASIVKEKLTLIRNSRGELVLEMTEIVKKAGG